MRRWVLWTALLMIASGSSGAGEVNLGQIDFPTSGSPAAQETFLQGVLWLHSFEYEDARQEFRAAQKFCNSRI